MPSNITSNATVKDIESALIDQYGRRNITERTLSDSQGKWEFKITSKSAGKCLAQATPDGVRLGVATRTMKRAILALLLLSTLALFAGCSRAPKLTVINRSTAELTNVVAAGSGFTQTIGSIPAGGQRSVSVSPRGESNLQLDFDANGKHFTSAPQGYFENSSSYKVTVTVAPDFTVTVDTKL